MTALATPTKSTRLYKVTTPTSVHLVEAQNQHRAISHVARKQISAAIPPQHEVFQLAKSGLEIEVAGEHGVSDETRQNVSQDQLPGVGG